MSVNDEGYKIALEDGRQSVKEGGVGIGSSIISADGKLLGSGRNMRYVELSVSLSRKTQELT